MNSVNFVLSGDIVIWLTSIHWTVHSLLRRLAAVSLTRSWNCGVLAVVPLPTEQLGGSDEPSVRCSTCCWQSPRRPCWRSLALFDQCRTKFLPLKENKTDIESMNSLDFWSLVSLISNEYGQFLTLTCLKINMNIETQRLLLFWIGNLGFVTFHQIWKWFKIYKKIQDLCHLLCYPFESLFYRE